MLTSLDVFSYHLDAAMPDSPSSTIIQRRLRRMRLSFNTKPSEAPSNRARLHDLVNAVLIQCRIRKVYKSTNPQPRELPIEVLEVIIRQLLPTEALSIRLPRDDLTDLDSGEDTWQTRTVPTFVLRDPRQTLLNFILVCRQWCWFGIRYLYAYPLLHSNRHARILLRTLKHYPNNPVINIQELALVWDKKTNQRPDTIRSILERSPSLDTLVIVLHHNLTLDKPWMLEKLVSVRRLTIQGYRTAGLTSNLELRAKLTASPISQTLANLQLVDVYFGAFTNMLLQTISRQVETLEIYVTYPSLLFPHVQTNDTWYGVKHLVMGVICPESYNSVLKMRRETEGEIPYRIESMTILLSFPYMSGAHNGYYDSQFWRFLDVITYLLRDLPHKRSLKTVILVLQMTFDNVTGGVLEDAMADFHRFFDDVAWSTARWFQEHLGRELQRHGPHLKLIPLWCSK